MKKKEVIKYLKNKINYLKYRQKYDCPYFSSDYDMEIKNIEDCIDVLKEY